MYVSGNFVAGVRSFKSWVVAAVAVLVAVLFWLSSCGVSLAAEQVRLDNGDLVFEEVVETRRVSGVPAGLTAEQARQLVSGEVSDVVVSTEYILPTVSGPLPVTLEGSSEETVAAYTRENGWLTSTVLSELPPTRSWLATGVFLILSLLSMGAGVYMASEARIFDTQKTWPFGTNVWLVLSVQVSAIIVAFMISTGLLGLWVIVACVAVLTLLGIVANNLYFSDGEGIALGMFGPALTMGFGSLVFVLGTLPMQVTYLSIVIGGLLLYLSLHLSAPTGERAQGNQT